MKRCLIVLLLIIIIAGSSSCSSGSNRNNVVGTPDVTQTPDIQPIGTEAPAQSNMEEETIQSESLTPNGKLRFVVFADGRGSDHGVNSEIVKKILTNIKQLIPQPEFAIMPGDLTGGSKTYLDTKAQLDYFKDIITQFYPIEFFYPGIGNHEMKAGKNGEKAFSETFNEFKANFPKGYQRTSYYFDVGDTRLFMLNSNHIGENHKISGEQLKWLKKNIDQKRKRNIFFLHEPPYPTGSGVGNSLDSHSEARNDFWKVADTAVGAIVFCGHEHNYSRRLIDNSFNEKIGKKSYKFSNKVYQIVTGGAGAPLYKQYTNKKNVVVPPVPRYHYTIVDMDGSLVNIQAVDIDGNIIDTFQVQ